MHLHTHIKISFTVQANYMKNILDRASNAKTLKFLLRSVQQRPVKRFTARAARSFSWSVRLMEEIPEIIRVPTHSEINPEEKLK